MRLTRWNGEYWYEDRRPIWRHIVEWFVWVGGSRKYGLTPISLFGHRVTFFGWGWNARINGGYLVRVTRGVDKGMYWSPDGTPTHATVWFSKPSGSSAYGLREIKKVRS